MYRVEDKYLLNKTDMFILEHRISAVLPPDFFLPTEVTRYPVYTLMIYIIHVFKTR